jgi:hypothetical protein
MLRFIARNVKAIFHAGEVGADYKYHFNAVLSSNRF